MAPETEMSQVSNKARWAGNILSALPVAMLLMSGIMKLLKTQQVVEGFEHFGFGENYIQGIGIVELACVAIYIVPRTSVLGAILLTGYLGGATVTHLRLGEWAFVSPVVLGMLLWGGMVLRDAQLRTLLPLRR